eukprot:Awhi_evm2s13920
MVKVMTNHKVVIVLNGRFAGRKAVIVKSCEEGDKDHKYGYAVVAGIDRHPLKVNRRMNKHKIAKRSKLRPFVKVINYNHLLPTRYKLEVSKDLVNHEEIKDPAARKECRKNVKKLLEAKYKAGENR